MALIREQLAKMRHIPREDSVAARGRLEARRGRLDEQYEWSMIDAVTYKAKRAAARVLPMGTILRDAPARQQRQIVRHIVGRVEVRDGALAEIVARPEAAPFFAGAVYAERPRRELGARYRRETVLAWYVA